MADRLSPEQRHLNMSHVRSVNTKPELALRHALWHLGFRYRVNDRRLPGKPDILLPKFRTVIFIHGCFWHGHKGCSKYSVPKTNTEFWTAKITRNKERDQETWRQLEAKGWAVIIIWECELTKARFADTIDRVEAEILRNGELLRSVQDDRRKAREAYQQERSEQKAREAAITEELRQKYPR